MVHFVVLQICRSNREGTRGQQLAVLSPLPIDFGLKSVECENSLRSEKINLLEGDTLPLIRSGRALGTRIRE